MISQVKVTNMPVPKPPANKKEQKDFLKSNHLVCMAESEELANQLIDKNVGDCLKTYGEKALLDLHITDQQVYSRFPMFLRARIRIGKTPEEHEAALRVMKSVFQILDKIPKIRLSESARKKSLLVRKSLGTDKNREEEEAEEQKHLEKKRKEELEWQQKLKTMPLEQQKKMEEKKRKQDLEKQKKKMMKVMKH